VGLAMDDVGIFYGHLVDFAAIWYILWTFIVYFVVIWYIFLVLVSCTKKNLATPNLKSRQSGQVSEKNDCLKTFQKS
jgi:phosphotransferase system  glucose/maltose/N-acetylglucosamine-specific IIC component